MQPFRILVVTFCFTLVAGGAAFGQVLLRNVNVLSMESEILTPSQDVLVIDGRFAAKEPSGTIKSKKKWTVVDAQDQFLIPGLMDLHVHFRGGSARQPDQFYLYLANGVTTVLSMGGSKVVLELRRKVNAGELLGPRIFTTSPIMGNLAPNPATAQVARERVTKYVNDGYDFIKVYNQIPAEGYWGIIETAKELDIQVVGHAVRSVGIEGALEAGQDIAHMEEFIYGYLDNTLDESLLEPLAKKVVAADISVITTLSAYRTILRQLTDLDAALASPGVEYLPWNLVRDYQADRNEYTNSFDQEDLHDMLEPSMAFLQKMTAVFEKEGATLLTGTDAVMGVVVPGFSMHDELGELVQAGLSPYQALRAGTVMPSRYLGIEEQVGTIAVGKAADGLLLSANPLVNIANTRKISGVLVRGDWFARQAIDDGLEAIAERVRAERE